MAKSKLALVKKPKRHNRATKNRKDYPYVVFQVEKGLHGRLRRKAKQKDTSMSAFVEDLIRKAV